MKLPNRVLQLTFQFVMALASSANLAQASEHYNPLHVVPIYAELGLGQTQVFKVTGGKPPYDFLGQTAGELSREGVYTAPAKWGATDPSIVWQDIEISDVLGYIIHAHIKLRPISKPIVPVDDVGVKVVALRDGARLAKRASEKYALEMIGVLNDHFEQKLHFHLVSYETLDSPQDFETHTVEEGEGSLKRLSARSNDSSVIWIYLTNGMMGSVLEGNMTGIANINQPLYENENKAVALILSEDAKSTNLSHEVGHLMGFEHTADLTNHKIGRTYHGCAQKIHYTTYPFTIAPLVAPGAANNIMSYDRFLGTKRTFFSSGYASAFSKIIECWKIKSGVARAMADQN